MRNVVCVLGLLLCCNFLGNAQELKLYTELPDAQEKKILFGQVTKKQITEDADFAWYKTNSKYARPPQTTIDAIRKAAGKVDIVLFVGTWCHDTQQILPKYLKALEEAGFSEDKLTIIATNRAKEAPGGLHKVFHVLNVPTIIVMQQGKEIGRIVEYGETGLPEKELGDLFSKLN